jgi:tetratricopeptide (TPR) repeat protein/transcriptional regulator with XRE-family HTH domain
MDDDFAALLRRHRRAAGITQELLAQRAYLSLAAVSALERGVRRRPHNETVAALADALGLTESQRAPFRAAASGKSHAQSPRQLPAAAADFTGREPEFARLKAALSRGEGSTVVAITGMGGAGKTALALQVAHAVADDYPGGQLYLDLHGFGGSEPVRPIDALAWILTALDVLPADVPQTVDEAAATMRSFLAHRRVLLMLDNARDAQQIEPLLPGRGRSAAIVTSRHNLSVLPTTQTVRLDLWSEEEGLDYLARTVGDRIGHEQDAATDVLTACGLLPLAVRIAAGRLASRPAWTVAHLASLLHDERHRLDQLQGPDLGVRAGFAVSIDQLAGSERPRERRAADAFAMAGHSPGPDLSTEVAARLFECTEREAEQALEDLCDLNLAESGTPGRYRLHDLLRTYAAERSPAAEHAPALTRLLDLHAAVACESIRLSVPSATRLPWLKARLPNRFTDAASAMSWLDSQRAHLVPLMTEAAATPGVPARSLLQLAMGLNAFYMTRGHWLEWHRINTIAVDIARAERDVTAEAFIRNDLGLVCYDLILDGSRRTTDAIRELRHSLALFEQLGLDGPAAMSLTNLSHVFTHAGDHDEAVGCGVRATAIYQRMDDTHGEALTYINIAQSYGGLGRAEEQRKSYERSIEVATAHGDDRVLAEALLGSGTAYRREGNLDAAIRELTRSVEVFRSFHDLLLLAEALDELGVAHRLAGEPDAAAQRHEEALTIASSSDDGTRLSSIRRNLDEVKRSLGKGE